MDLELDLELDLEADLEDDLEADLEDDLELDLEVDLGVGSEVGFAVEDDDSGFDVRVGALGSPSSPSSSSGLSVIRGQELAVVVDTVGLTLQPLDVAELVVLQLAELVDPEVTVVQETKKLVTSDVEHEVVVSGSLGSSGFSGSSEPPRSSVIDPGGGPMGGSGSIGSLKSNVPQFMKHGWSQNTALAMPDAMAPRGPGNAAAAPTAGSHG